MAGGGEASIRPVGPGDVQSAFAQAAAEDGIVLSRQSFDWLCEQGHVGLERVAKARRDPALVRAGEGGAGAARGDLRAPRRRRVGAARVAREPAAAGRPRARADRHGDRGRRLGALHVVPARRRSSCTAPTRPSGSTSASTRELCRAWCARTDGARSRARREGLRIRRACRGSARTTTRCAIWRRRRWAIRRSSGSRPSTATARPPTGATGPRCSRSALPQRRVLDVGRRDVDRRAARALDAHLERHLDVVHRLGEDVAARDAHVVVRPVAAEGGPVDGLLDRRRRRRAGPRPAGPRASSPAPSRQSFAELGGEVRDQRVEHARRRRPRPSTRPCR